MRRCDRARHHSAAARRVRPRRARCRPGAASARRGHGPPRAPPIRSSGEASSASARSTSVSARKHGSIGLADQVDAPRVRAPARRPAVRETRADAPAPTGAGPAPRRRPGLASSAAMSANGLGLVEPAELVERLREQRGDVRPEVALVHRRERVVVGAELRLGRLRIARHQLDPRRGVRRPGGEHGRAEVAQELAGPGDQLAGPCRSRPTSRAAGRARGARAPRPDGRRGRGAAPPRPARSPRAPVWGPRSAPSRTSAERRAIWRSSPAIRA